MLRINPVGKGFGNDMYQYSFCRSVSEKLGYKFYIGKGKNYHFGPGEFRTEKYFNVDLGEEDGRIMNNFYEGLKEQTILQGQKNIHFIKGLLNMSHKTPNYKANINKIIEHIPDFTLLHGFYNRSIYFEDYFDQLIDWFEFKEEHNSVIDKYNIEDYCFIHFRGTDYYKHFQNKEQFLSKEYYENAIKYFNMNKYIIITDDINLAEEYFKWMQEEDIEYHILCNNEILDFYTLTRAKYYIGSYSTFSDWAGYLNIHKYKMLFPYNIKYIISGFHPTHFFKYLTKIDDKLQVVNL